MLYIQCTYLNWPVTVVCLGRLAELNPDLLLFAPSLTQVGLWRDEGGDRERDLSSQTAGLHRDPISKTNTTEKTKSLRQRFDCKLLFQITTPEAKTGGS